MVLIVHIQNVANSFRQTGPRKRLLNKLNAGIETALVYNGVARISGHNNTFIPARLASTAFASSRPFRLGKITSVKSKSM